MLKVINLPEMSKSKKTMLTSKQKKRIARLVGIGASLAALYGYSKLKDLGVIDNFSEKAKKAGSEINKKYNSINKARKRVVRALRNPKPVDWSEIAKMTKKINYANGGQMPFGIDPRKTAMSYYLVNRINDHQRFSFQPTTPMSYYGKNVQIFSRR